MKIIDKLTSQEKESQLLRIREILNKRQPLYLRSTREGKKRWEAIYLKKDNEGTLYTTETQTNQDPEAFLRVLDSREDDKPIHEKSFIWSEDSDFWP